MQKAISKYWPIFVLPTLVAFIIGFIWPFIWGVYLSFQRFTTVSKDVYKRQTPHRPRYRSLCTLGLADPQGPQVQKEVLQKWQSTKPC